MPPIMRLDIIENNGEIDVKTAYIPGVDSLAIKISPGFFDNPELAAPAPVWSKHCYSTTAT
jgi:ornithine cyclodeaminase